MSIIKYRSKEKGGDKVKRSTYSLILMDDVVAAIDRLAMKQGMSRSNLINQLLAEYVSYTTPEQQMRKIFSCLTKQMDSAFRIQEQSSNAVLSILGSIQYKYRPTIRYNIVLYRDIQQDKIGELRVTCRTQNTALLDAMQSFFYFWVKLESFYDPKGAIAQGMYEIVPGRFSKQIIRRGVNEDTILGALVGDYIQMFHMVLQSYFRGQQQMLSVQALQQTLEQEYVALRKDFMNRL